jgi:RNA polymerase sigma-70 factor (ECF subfamily)
LLTIAHNKTRDYFRRRGDEPCAAGGTEASLRLLQIADPHTEADLLNVGDEAIVDGVLGQALESIRGEFHERTWRAFWGVVVEGRAVADVAADLDMRPGTVRVAKSRVLLRLRNELGDTDAR